MGTVREKIQSGVEALANAAAVLPNATPNTRLDIDPGERSGAIPEKAEDFGVPQTIKDLLTPSLADLGFKIVTVQFEGMPGTKPGSCDVIRNAAGERAMLHFPKQVLEDELVWQSVGNVFQRLMLSNQIVLILSEGLEAANVIYDTVGRQLWMKLYTVTAPFLPWTHLVPSKPMAKSVRLTVLPKLLQLEDLITKAQEAAPINKPALVITTEDVAALANILSQLPEVVDKGATGWRLYMDQAGLKELRGSFDLAGKPRIVALGLIDFLNDHKPLPDQPEDQVLGRFLSAVLTISELKQADKDKINRILKTYNLMRSSSHP